MYMKDAHRFLIRTAIPEVTNQWHIPVDEDIAECFPVVSPVVYEEPVVFPAVNEKPAAPFRKSNIIWDAIWSAHEHVIPVSFETAQLYWGIDRDGKMIELKGLDKAIPGMARELFALIRGSDRPMSSQDLIFKLYEVFPEPEEKPLRGMT